MYSIVQEIHFGTICEAFGTEFMITAKYFAAYNDKFDILIGPSLQF